MTMSHENQPQSEQIRVFVTGSCEGSRQVCEALAAHPDLDLVGAAE